MAYPVLLVNIPFFYAKNFKKKYWFLKIFWGDNINAVSFKGTDHLIVRGVGRGGYVFPPAGI